MTYITPNVTRIKYSVSCGGGTKERVAGSNLHMLYSGNKRKRFVNAWPTILAIILFVTSPLVIAAQQSPAGDKPAASDEVVSVAVPGLPLNLLPDTLAGHKATADLRQVGRDNLVDFVADKAPIYQEYFVVSAVSRKYAGARVQVFETRNQFAALGLFQFNSGPGKPEPRN
jgi:hypothetical protein